MNTSPSKAKKSAQDKLSPFQGLAGMLSHLPVGKLFDEGDLLGFVSETSSDYPFLRPLKRFSGRGRGARWPERLVKSVECLEDQGLIAFNRRRSFHVRRYAGAEMMRHLPRRRRLFLKMAERFGKYLDAKR